MKIIKEPEKTMILRMHLGDGVVDKEETFSFGYNAKGLIFYFSTEGRYYVVPFDSIIEDVIKYRATHHR